MKIGDLWLLVEPDFEQAEAAYRKAKELQPTDKTYDFRLDDVEIKRMDKALKDLETRQVALPPASATGPHRALAPSVNVTPPVGAPAPGGGTDTVAVRVTAPP